MAGGVLAVWLCSENQRPTQTSCVVAGRVLAVSLCSENHRPTQTSCVVAGRVLAVSLCSENQRPTQTSCVVAGRGVGRLAGVVKISAPRRRAAWWRDGCWPFAV